MVIMAGATRPVCAWCGLEGHYGFEMVSYKGPIWQFLINGVQVWLHRRYEPS
jgi:hypothetical protein